MAVPVPLVNGTYFAYADIEFQIGAGIYLGLKSINYGNKLQRQFVRGTNREPLGQTSGQYEPTADFEIYLPQLQFLLQQLGPGYMQVSIPAITVSYGTDPETLPIGVTTDIIQNARIVDIEASQSEGLDALVRKVTLMPQRILLNGQSAVTVPLGGKPFVVG